ncbi:MAG: twin-arginine translocase TatA/TatE family subunit [Melioribacteraceae bacterium]|nr:twin-arginine translocase TatA/TatE family subunit [Melioribacteraceae bacterium]
MFGTRRYGNITDSLCILILFGGKKLPELAKGIGKGIKELKSSMKEVQEDMDIEKELKN